MIHAPFLLLSCEISSEWWEFCNKQAYLHKPISVEWTPVMQSHGPGRDCLSSGTVGVNTGNLSRQMLPKEINNLPSLIYISFTNNYPSNILIYNVITSYFDETKNTIWPTTSQPDSLLTTCVYVHRQTSEYKRVSFSALFVFIPSPSPNYTSLTWEMDVNETCLVCHWYTIPIVGFLKLLFPQTQIKLALDSR